MPKGTIRSPFIPPEFVWRDFSSNVFHQIIIKQYWEKIPFYNPLGVLIKKLGGK